MRFGPTSLQLASALAKGLHQPKFRTDLRVSEQVFGGDVSYMVKVPETSNYIRFTPYEYDLLRLFDGTRAPANAAEALNELYPDAPATEQDVLEFLDLTDPNLWDRGLGQRNLAVLQKIREERKSRVDRSSLLYFNLFTVDSDQILDAIYPYLRWAFTPAFVITSILLLLWMTGIIISDFNRIRADTFEFFTFTHKSLYDIWVFWLLLFIILGIHEFGHGLTCKHFGGKVPKMGVMLQYFNPAFFTECSDMVLFEKPSERLWTIWAGLWIEMLICAVGTILWYYTLPGSALNDLCYKVLLFTGLSAILFNLNPLIKYDGYFLLCQHLEIEDLSEHSFDYLKAWLRRNILRQNIELPPASHHKRRIFLVYGLLSFVYSVFVIVLFLIFTKNVFVRTFGTDAGYLFTALVLYLVLRKRVKSLIAKLRAEWRGAKERLMAWKMSRQRWMGTGILALVLLVPFTPNEVSSDFLLEPGNHADVRSTVSGIVAQVRVREGDPVEAGAVLAVLHNPELETRATDANQKFQLAEHAQLAARASNDWSEIARATHERQSLETEVAETRREVAGLTLRAPFAGIVTTPVVEQKVGQYLNPGDLLATVVNRGEMKARVLVHDWELQDVREDAKVRLKVRSYPLQTFRGRVQQILPAAALDRPPSDPVRVERYGQELTNYFAVVLEIPNPDGELREGMTGTAKIYGKYNPLIWRGARGAWRWLRSQVF
jgi:putative peptide zinc metalloprotease protein